METKTPNIKYDKNKNQLDGLLKGDVVTFLLIHTKYYLNQTNNSSENNLTVAGNSVSASIIKIKRHGIKHSINTPIIHYDANSNTKWNVVTTIQFDLLVNEAYTSSSSSSYTYKSSYIFSFNKLDKFYIDIFIDDVNNPSANYKLHERILFTYINSVRHSARNPLSDIERIKSYLSSITENEKFNNTIIEYINILNKIQSLSNNITLELSKLNEITNIDELKRGFISVKSPELIELNNKLNFFTKSLKTEMVNFLTQSGVTTNQGYKENKHLIKENIDLQFKNPSNYLDLETTSQNATNIIVIMEEVIDDLKKIDFNNSGSDNEDAITKIKNIYERFYTRTSHLSSTGRREANVIEVKPNKKTTDTTEQNSVGVIKHKRLITEKTVKQQQREEVLNRNKRLNTNFQGDGGKRLNNNHNKSIKKPKK